jgi:hypothetical protein
MSGEVLLSMSSFGGNDGRERKEDKCCVLTWWKGRKVNVPNTV